MYPADDYDVIAADKSMLEDIRRIERYCFYPYLYRTSRYFAKKINTGNLVVVRFNQCCAGYMAFTRHRHYADISDLAVDINFRRCGVATAMLKWAEQRGRFWGVPKLQLTVDEENTPAVETYRKFGFQVIKKRKNYYGIRSGLVMCHRI